MAKICVYRFEASGGRLPRTCMCCGRPVDVDVPYTFSWRPSWILVFIFFGVWPYLLLSMLMQKSMPVVAPMCHAHAGHWRNRSLFVWLGILFWIVYAVVVGAIIDSLPIEMQRVLAFGGTFALFVWIISAAIYSNSAIKASKIDDKSIELTGVHKDFAKEWNSMQS